MRSSFYISSLLLAACASGEQQADRAAPATSVQPQGQQPRQLPPPPATQRPSLGGTKFAPPRVPADPMLSRMLAAMAPFQAYQQPCIAREPLRPDFSPEQNRRSKAVWSDSLELQRRIRAAHASRILNMAPDISLGADKTRFIVKVTGLVPLPTYRLGGRARDVPVVVEYGMPYSADQLQQKVNASHDELMRLLPDAQGWGVNNGFGLGGLFIQVYSPTGQPPANLTSLCEQLIHATGMPVLLTYSMGRISVEPGVSSSNRGIGHRLRRGGS